MGDNHGTGWMYNPDSEMNKEDYLLGKKIDKGFESQGTMGQINAVEYDCAPPSIFASQAQHQVDMQRKLMEDPLVLIKKRELEERKRILDNPLKVRALQEHIESLKQAKKDKKKKKKKKKKRKGSSDSEESDTDLDLKLLQRLQRIEGRETAGADEDQQPEESPSAKYRRDASPSPDTPPRARKQFNPKFRDGPHNHHRPQLDDGTPPPPSVRRDVHRRKSSSRSPPPRRRSRSPARRRSRSQSPAKRRSRSRSPAGRRRSRSPAARRSRSRSRGAARRRSRSPAAPRQRRSRSRTPVKRRHGSQERRKDRSEGEVVVKQEKEDEKARKLREMMENAAWRDEQRTKKVQAYRDKEQQEEEERRREHDPEFLARQLKKAAANSSLETRIRSNKYNIQRDHGVMDKNFARR